MPTLKITKRVVDAVGADDIAQIIRDTEVQGFLVVITKTGKKSYAVEYRIGKGRGAPKRRYNIGKHGSPWTPEQARAEAKRLLSVVAAGGDPLKARYPSGEAMKLEDLCNLYLDEGVHHKKASTLRGDRSRIKHYLIPRLGKRPVLQISRADIERLVREVSIMPQQIKATKKINRFTVIGGRGAASQCVAVIGAIFTFAINRGICTSNPARGVKKPPARKMERFLNVEEIKRLISAIAAEAQRSGNP